MPIRTKDKSDQVVDTHKTTLLTLVRKDPVLDEILLAKGRKDFSLCPKKIE